MTVKFGADISYFLWSVGTGFIFALFYDFVKALRKVLKIPDIVINIIDVFLLLVCGFVTVQIAYYVNNGEIRIYSILCISLAFLLYRLIMGHLLACMLEKIIKGIFRGIGKMVKALIFPANIALKIIGKIYRNMLCIKDKIYSKIKMKKA